MCIAPDDAGRHALRQEDHVYRPRRRRVTPSARRAMSMDRDTHRPALSLAVVRSTPFVYNSPLHLVPAFIRTGR
jgi:hypothetical protein